MRIRKKPWVQPELQSSPLYIKQPESSKGRWSALFSEKQPLHLEFGCGKGGFLANIALNNPHINYIGVDIKDEMLGRAKRAIESINLTKNNVLITAYNIEMIDNIFSHDDNIERIYINFPNPWYKAKHKKHRMTFPRQLNLYKNILKPGAEIWLKTDDDELYHDSLTYFPEAGYTIIAHTDDLYSSDIPTYETTEHERQFLELSKTIKFIKAKL